MGSWLVAGAIGFISGVLSGSFGIGGGIITTPAIRLLMDAPALIAVGTPLPVIIPSAVTGASSYIRSGWAHPRAAVIMGVSGAGTAIIGAMTATRVGGSVVLVGTAILLTYAAIDMGLQVIRPPVSREVPSSSDEGTVRPDCARLDLPTGALVAVGVLAGAYSGFFGLGGGFVIVPLLTRWIRLPLKCAIGTSLITVAILAVPGTITHAVLGNIDWAIAAALTLGVVPGALVGARLTLGAGERSVRIAFALMLVAVAVWLAANELPAVLPR